MCWNGFVNKSVLKRCLIKQPALGRAPGYTIRWGGTAVTGVPDDVQPRGRLRFTRVLVLCGVLCGITGLGWHGVASLSLSVDAANRPLEPVKDAEQDLPARHFVLAHTRTDGLIETPGGEQAARPLVLDRALT